MGLLDIASGNSFWRGYDYYKDGKVISNKKLSDSLYTGLVAGSREKPYEVTINLEHPKKSRCDCLHAEGNRRVCKHKVALYFSFFPKEADKAIKEAEEWEAEEEQRQQEEYKEMEKYVYSLSMQQLRDELLWRMIEESDRRRW